MTTPERKALRAAFVGHAAIIMLRIVEDETTVPPDVRWVYQRALDAVDRHMKTLTADPMPEKLEAWFQLSLDHILAAHTCTAEERIADVRQEAEKWAAKAEPDDWADGIADTVLSDAGRHLLRIIDAEDPE